MLLELVFVWNSLYGLLKGMASRTRGFWSFMDGFSCVSRPRAFWSFMDCFSCVLFLLFEHYLKGKSIEVRNKDIPPKEAMNT